MIELCIFECKMALFPSVMKSIAIPSRLAIIVVGFCLFFEIVQICCIFLTSPMGKDPKDGKDSIKSVSTDNASLITYFLLKFTYQVS